MYQYETSPYANVSPSWGLFQNPLQGAGFQSPQMQGTLGQGQQRYPTFQTWQSSFPLQSAPYMGSPFLGTQFQGSQAGIQPEYAGFAGRQGFLSPEEFAGSIGRYGQFQPATLAPIDPIFITELSRSARGLQDVAELLEGKEPDVQRKGLYASTAHLFYAFGLLSSKGIFIPGDLPGRVRSEVGGPANACREFGKQLERFVEKAASGRTVVEELSRLVERGTACYAEITKGIEGAETAEQPRKKIA